MGIGQGHLQGHPTRRAVVDYFSQLFTVRHVSHYFDAHVVETQRLRRGTVRRHKTPGAKTPNIRRLFGVVASSYEYEGVLRSAQMLHRLSLEHTYLTVHRQT
ncbi:MAG: hypothetical protein MUQ56_02950, partial [Thermoleophilia bacterium]|nr:hypothetical protein [Thermoleophilia bacterium]